MNRRFLGLIGAAALLSACNVTVSGGGTDLSISANSLTLTSEYTASNLSFNGITYSGPVICDDRTTNMSFDFDYTGNLNSVILNLKGAKTGQEAALKITNSSLEGGHGAVDFYADFGSVPLSVPNSHNISSQSIIVNPIVIGATSVQMVAYTDGGATRTITSNALPVVASCNI